VNTKNTQTHKILLRHVGECVGKPGLKVKAFHREYLVTHGRKNPKVKILDYIPISQAIKKGVWPKDSARIAATMTAAYECAKEYGLSKDEIDRLIAEDEPSQEKLTALPKTLKGAWIMVQFRGRRITPRQEFPPLDYRIAVLVYGMDDESNKRYFEIIGEETFWQGKAWLLHEQVYFWADEIKRPDVKEALAMILFKIDTDADIDHHGILVSVAHGGPRGPGYPILASRVLLYRSQSLSGKLHVKLDKETREQIKQQWCKYVSDAELRKIKTAHNEVDREIYQAIQAFKERGRRS
jgi:hypothetical protein